MCCVLFVMLAIATVIFYDYSVIYTKFIHSIYHQGGYLVVLCAVTLLSYLC